jgi:hypothetical protein
MGRQRVFLFLACAPSEPSSEPVEVVEPSDTSVVDTSTDDPQDSADSATEPVDSGADSGADSGGDSAVDTGGPDTDTGGDTDEWLPAPDAVADWSLPDLNPGSSRFGETISPRDYLSRVSGFYFVRST